MTCSSYIPMIFSQLVLSFLKKKFLQYLWNYFLRESHPTVHGNITEPNWQHVARTFRHSYTHRYYISTSIIIKVYNMNDISNISLYEQRSENYLMKFLTHTHSRKANIRKTLTDNDEVNWILPDLCGVRDKNNRASRMQRKIEDMIIQRKLFCSKSF